MRLAALLLTAIATSAFALACSSGSQNASTGDDQNVKASSKVDSIGCGDGVKSMPNGWFVGIDNDGSPLFQAVGIMSNNLFRIDSVTADNPAALNGSLDYPEDTSKTTALIFEVSFTPGRDSVENPSMHADSIKYRDQALTQLKSLGGEVECNGIMHAMPLGLKGAGDATPTPKPGDVDSMGCGDGVKSAPNGWFISFKRSSTKVFDELVLLSSNLFSIDNVAVETPNLLSGSLDYPDTSKVTNISVEETFMPGRNSIGMPNVQSASIKYRNKVLTELKGDGLEIDCNNILHMGHGPVLPPGK
jgi:hypothetical protein